MRSKVFDGLSIAGLAALAALVFATFRDYGISWDEPAQATYGELILRFFQSGFADRSALEFGNLYLYGGVFEAAAQSLARLSPYPVFDTRHLLTALIGLLAYAGAWRFARHLGGPPAGFLALLFLAGVPSFYGHMFMNPKDIPFAAGYVWTLYLSVRAAETLPNIPMRRALPLGLALGLTLGVRIGGVLLIGYMGLLVLLYHVWLKGRRTRPEGGQAGATTSVKKTVTAAVAVLLPAYVLMIAFWPWALQSPLSAPYRALLETTRFKWEGTVLFKGAYVQSVDLPVDYLPVYFGLKLPEFLLAILAIALPSAVVHARRAVSRGDWRQVLGYAALGLGVIFPPVYSILFKAVHYDAIRHFLFILPPLAVLAGLEAGRVGGWLMARRPSVFGASAALLAVAIAYTGLTMFRIHPYQYAYYNSLAGGLRGAAGRYELDYWATSYKELARKLAVYALQDAAGRGLPPEEQAFRVVVCGPGVPALRFLPAHFRPVDRLDQADFFIAFTRWGCDRRVEAPVAVAVERLDTRLAVAMDLRRGFRMNRPGSNTTN
jgi:hypothetical protein